jgi:hypothetical protein
LDWLYIDPVRGTPPQPSKPGFCGGSQEPRHEKFAANVSCGPGQVPESNFEGNFQISSPKLQELEILLLEISLEIGFRRLSPLSLL